MYPKSIRRTSTCANTIYNNTQIYNGSHNRCEKTFLYAKNKGIDQIVHRAVFSAPLLFFYLKVFYLYLLCVHAKFYILASLCKCSLTGLKVKVKILVFKSVIDGCFHKNKIQIFFEEGEIFVN